MIKEFDENNGKELDEFFFGSVISLVSELA